MATHSRLRAMPLEQNWPARRSEWPFLAGRFTYCQDKYNGLSLYLYMLEATWTIAGQADIVFGPAHPGYSLHCTHNAPAGKGSAFCSDTAIVMITVMEYQEVEKKKYHAALSITVAVLHTILWHSGEPAIIICCMFKKGRTRDVINTLCCVTSLRHFDCTPELEKRQAQATPRRFWYVQEYWIPLKGTCQKWNRTP